MTTYVMPEMTCPGCGHIFNRASQVDSDTGKPKKPHADDLTICVKCGDIWAFDEQMKLVTPKLDLIMALTPRQRWVVEKSQEYIRTQRPVKD